MPNAYTAEIDYFFQEGKENLEQCLQIAFEAAIARDLKNIVIFTGVGQGPRIAVERFLSQPKFKNIQIIAVTFPYGQRFKDGAQIEIDAETRKFLKKHNVPVVRAHLPFTPIAAHYSGHGSLGQDLTLIGNALSIFGGSMSLCVQAALVACDAGYLELGEHTISLTSDTAIVVRTSPTQNLLRDFIVREILCKPMTLTILKHEPLPNALRPPSTIEGIPADETEPAMLPPAKSEE